MAFLRTRLHPLVAAASVSVIIASLTASAVMTGVLPANIRLAPDRTVVASGQQQAATKPGLPVEAMPTSGDAANGTSASGGGGGAAALAGAAGAGRLGTLTNGLTVSGTDPRAPAVQLRASPGILAGPDAATSPAATPWTLPAVFIHVYNRSARQQVLQLEPRLRQRGMRLAGIKIIGTGPTQSDLRYFRASEKSEAVTVQAALLSAGLPVRQLKRITGYETRAIPRQYEVWLSPDFQMQH